MQSKKVKTNLKQIFQFSIVGLVVFGFSFYIANVSNAQEDYQYTTQISDVKTVKLVRDIALEYLENTDGVIKNKYLEIDIEKKFDEKKLKG